MPFRTLLPAKLFCCLLLLLGLGSSAQAQNTYADHKPSYRPWTRNYILDKIEYTKESMVFHFRSMCQHSMYNRATFYPKGGEYAWYLVDKSTGQEYEMLTVKNLRKNGKLEAAEVKEVMTIMADMKSGKPYTIFSCEVHFPRLPKGVTKVDFIEGRGGESKRNHYNCFDVIIKSPDDKDLGIPKDSENNIKEFEERFSKPQKDSVKKEDPKPKPAPGPAKELTQKEDIQCDQQLILSKIRFKDNSPEFTSLVQARQTLDLLFEFMKANPQSELLLEGHTDIFGNKERNKELSYQRALTIQRYLSGLGINPKRIHLRWYGGEKPLFPEGNAKNRRVEAKVSCEPIPSQE